MIKSYAHIIAGFTFGFRCRRQLAELLQSTPVNRTILTIDHDELIASGIKTLALDFDGVLAHHGAATPLPEAIVWMKNCEKAFGGNNIFILSNKPTDERKHWFANHFPEMRFISGVPKKPFPDGLIKTGELAGVPLNSILMVDDRLLTGCLAAIIAGARPCYIRKPYTCFSFRPFAELFFGMLRRLERVFIRITSLF